jgi:hypothetical protein
MQINDTELFFPMKNLPLLKNARGDEWKALIEKVTAPNADPVDPIALSVMLIKLGGCANCNVDSFRAMRGCMECAKLTLRRYKNSDKDLIQLFESTRKEVTEFFAEKK